MHDELSPVRTSISTPQQHWTTSSPAETLTAIRAEGDRLLARLTSQIASLVDQAALAQNTLRECEMHALFLDAWVDDALYRGDAKTARACSDRALLLRDELDLLIGDMQRIAANARRCHDQVNDLGARVRE
jgi:hypothetical protein